MQPYRQTTDYTTAAASLLTILHHLKSEIELCKENEFDIWHKTVNLPTRACSLYGLAAYAKNKGIDCQIVVEKEEYDFPDYRFYRYTKEDVQEAGYSDARHKRSIPNGEIQTREITLLDIERLLREGRILLLRLNTKPFRDIKRNNSSYVVVYGVSEHGFEVMDPNQGTRSIAKEVFTESFESLGTKKHRDHRMLIF